MKKADGNEIKRVSEQLVVERMPLEVNWRDAYKYTYPLKGQYLNARAGTAEAVANGAAVDQARLMDSVGTESATLLASSIMSGLTPTSSQWFQFRIPGVDQSRLSYESRVWLENASKTLFSMIHNSSNFNVKLAKAKAGGMKEDDYLILRDRLDKGNVTYGELSIKEKNIIKMTDPQLAGITEEESKSLLSKANKKLGPVYRSVLVKQQVKGK